jgi:hypothetical protein
MKRQQLEKVMGKKIEGGYTSRELKRKGKERQQQPAREGQEPIAVKLIKGLERK